MTLDPKKIDIRHDEITVDMFMNRYKECLNELRCSNDWDNKQKSLLIESIILQIPSIRIWIHINGDNNTIIDGAKRAEVLYQFISGDLKLSDLAFLTELDDKTYAELPRSIQRRILETKIQIYYIGPGTGDLEAENISRRLKCRKEYEK